MPMLTLALDTNSNSPAMPKEKTPMQLAMARFGHNRVAIVGLVVMVLLILVAVFANYLTPYNPIKTNITKETRLNPPSTEHWMGTDALGRDTLTRIIYGGRASLWVGFATVLLAMGLGIPLGLISGYSGGIWDTIIMRIMDLILAFPGIIFAIWLVSMLGPGINQVIIANAFFTLPEYSRVIRGSVMSIKQIDYIHACRALGGNYFRILFFHVLPNVIAPIIVISCLGISSAIISGASLSFLGLGARPPTPEWGSLLAEGRPFMRTAWWLSIFPGLFLTTIVIAASLFGDGLRDALDPRADTKAK